jgi:putative hydrolase of the HAD superfamily
MVATVKSQLQCIVFDLDDTLYLERDYVRSGFHAVGQWCAEGLGLGGVRELAEELFEGGRRGDIFNAVLERLNVKPTDETVNAMVRVYREHNPKITLAVDAVNCLSALKGQVRLGLLTDGNSVTQWRKMQALGIRNTFEAIVVTGDWGAEFFKPNVRGFRHLERQFDCSPAHFTYVADNPSKDFTAPRELGWNAIRVRRPTGLYSQLFCPPDLARLEIGDLESLPELISRLT